MRKQVYTKETVDVVSCAPHCEVGLEREGLRFYDLISGSTHLVTGNLYQLSLIYRALRIQGMKDEVLKGLFVMAGTEGDDTFSKLIKEGYIL